MKKLLIIGIASVMIFTSLTGCATTKTKANNINLDKNNVATKVADSKDNIDYDQYKWVGQIIDYKEDGVHIISGDVIDIFDVSNGKEFYLGETVGVKEVEGVLVLERILNKDFSTRHTYMGEIIKSQKGIFEESDEESLTIKVDGKVVKYSTYQKYECEKGNEITIDYINRDGRNYVIDLFNEDNKLELNIKSIERAENTGIMILNTADNKGVEFIVYVTSRAVLNFNHVDLVNGDKIVVYPEVIMESYPAQVDPLKIDLLR